MVTALDSSVIFDLATHDPVFGPPSKRALEFCAAQGRVVACEVVWAEVGASFTSGAAALQMLNDLGIEFDPLAVEAALEAAMVWKAYREHGGPRARIAADFLIGAHALLQADRLLTRDHGFYRAYFKRLQIIDPSKSRH